MANGSEPWRIPRLDDLPQIPVEHPGPLADGETVPALRPRRAAGPALGPARHAGPDAPHRRAGEAGHHRQRQLRPGEPPADGPICGPRKSPTSPSDIPPQDGRGPGQRRVAGAELGRDLRRVRHGRPTAARSAGLSVAHAHLRYLNPLPGQPGRAPADAIAACWCPN